MATTQHEGNDGNGGEIETRVARLESAYGTQSPTIDQRLKALEAAAKEIGHRNRLLTGLDYVLKFLGALSPIAVIVVGFLIKDSVDFAFREREVSVKEGHLNVEAAKGMEHLLAALREKNISESTAQATAMLVTSYGSHGIRPLIVELDLDRSKRNRSNAAEAALQSYALTEDREEVCVTLQRGIAIRPVLFGDDGLERVVRLLGNLNCKSALKDLRSLESDAIGNDAARSAVSAAIGRLASGGQPQ